MLSKREYHLSFWRHFLQRLRDGVPTNQALNMTTAEETSTQLHDAVVRVARRVENGVALGDAMERQPQWFSPAVVAMVRAGEAGGVLDVIAERIAEGIEEGSLPLPGVELSMGRDEAYWRCFGRMLGSGVPVIGVLSILRHDVAEGELAEATGSVEGALLDGSTLAEAMRRRQDVFPEEICAIIESPDPHGSVAGAATRIAVAVAAGDLNSLRFGETADLPPVRGFVNTVILVAIQQKASDIHVDPLEYGKSRIRLRIDGVLHDLKWPDDVTVPLTPPHAEMVNRIKVQAGMDIAERRLPQDGRIELGTGDPPGEGRRVDLRVSTVPTVHGERIVMRVLQREVQLLTVGEMGLLEDDLAKIRQLCRVPHGTVLCSGPTGSGKTTLFYAMINTLDRERSCVMSIEDPVEYYIDGVAQMQVQPQIGRTFARLLRHVLRQDPDIILVGEIRDEEVANLVAQCSLTGHVVLTTLHAATAPGGLKRLVDMGIDPFVINASVAGVISQRLVRVVCKECREPVEPPAHSLPPEAVEMLAGREGATFYAARGCDACNGWGYRGRTCLHEILIPDDAFRQALSDGADLPTLRETARAGGMRTLLECGIEKAAQGITTVQEVLRVVPHGPNE